MKKHLFLIFVFFQLLTVAQSSFQIEPIDSITFKADLYLGKDVYNNHYFIEKNALKRVNQNTFFEFQDVALGKLNAIDFSNPLFLVLFYKDFNTIVLLDHQLNETQRISGNDLGLLFEIIGLARQNNLWFYDSIQQKFGLLNLKEVTHKFISTSFPTKFKNWKATYNNFQWITPESEVFAIDFFGKIQTLNSIEKADEVLILDKNKYLIEQGKRLFYFDQKTKTEIKIPHKSYQNFCFKDGILSIFTNDKVFNYKINLP